MGKKRDTQTYALYDGPKKVYIGTTNDLERRAEQHRDGGKDFTRVEPTSRRMTEEGAKAKETDQLEAYREGHDGRNPRYNKDSDG